MATDTAAKHRPVHWVTAEHAFEDAVASTVHTVRHAEVLAGEEYAALKAASRHHSQLWGFGVGMLGGLVLFSTLLKLGAAPRCKSASARA